MNAPGTTGLRIGELSRRVGVSPDVLRAWERRYGLLDPARTDSGQRLYSPGDEERVRHMQRHMARGFSAQVAARMAVEGTAGVTSGASVPGVPARPPPATASPAALSELTIELRAALDEMEGARADAAFDRLLGGFSLDTVLSQVVLPYLRGLGVRWERGEVSVAEEHFASGFVAGRLRGLARGWDQGDGRRALLACPPGERHDLGLLCFGLALRARGWRVSYLGGDTPTEALAGAADRLRPDVVVVAALLPAPFELAAPALAVLAAAHPLAIGGEGATAELAERVGARLLASEPVRAADGLAVLA